MNDSRLTGEVGQLGTALAPSAVCSVYDLSAVPTELPSANLVCSKRVEVRMWSLVREQTVPARVDRRFPFVGSRAYGRYGPGDHTTIGLSPLAVTLLSPARINPWAQAFMVLARVLAASVTYR